MCVSNHAELVKRCRCMSALAVIHSMSIRGVPVRSIYTIVLCYMRISLNATHVNRSEVGWLWTSVQLVIRYLCGKGLCTAYDEGVHPRSQWFLRVQVQCIM